MSFHRQSSDMYKLLTLFSVACFSFSTLAKVSSRSSMSFFSSEHSSSSFLFLAVNSALISSSSSSLSVVSLSLASSWILLLMSTSHLSSASERFSDFYQLWGFVNHFNIIQHLLKFAYFIVITYRCYVHLYGLISRAWSQAHVFWKTHCSLVSLSVSLKFREALWPHSPTVLKKFLLKTHLRSFHKDSD